MAKKPTEAGIWLADVPLLLDHERQVNDFLDSYLPLDWLPLPGRTYASTDSRLDSTTGPPHNIKPARLNWPQPPRLRINQWYWPTGASRWAMGLFLADETSKNQIEKKAFGKANPTTGVAKKIELRISDLSNQLKFDVWLIASRPITSVAGKQLWLLVVTDERYWFQFAAIPAGAFASTQTRPWHELLLQLSGMLFDFDSAEGPVDDSDASTIHADYLEADCEAFAATRNVAEALDAAAASVGRHVVRRLDGAYLLESADKAKSVYDLHEAKDWSLLAGGEHSRAILPHYSSCVFPRLENGFATGKWWSPTDSSVANETVIFDFSSAVRTVVSAASADFLPDDDDVYPSDPENSTALQTLADRIAADWAAWRQVQYDMTFAGLYPWRVVGFDDCVLISAGIELDRPEHEIHQPEDAPATLRTNRQRIFTTRVVSLPPEFGFTHQLSQDPTVKSFCRCAADRGFIVFLDSDGVTARDGGTLGKGRGTLFCPAVSDSDRVMQPYRRSDGEVRKVRVFNTVTESVDGDQVVQVKAVNAESIGCHECDWALLVDVVPCSTGGSGDTPGVPEVTNVSATTANGTYYTSDTIAITVAFSRAVTVTGSPRLLLSVIVPGVYATYASGSGTTTLTFNYTVGSDLESSLDLDYATTDSLELNGGTIRDALFGLDGDVTLPSPNTTGSLRVNKDIKINPPPHVITITSPDADGVYEETDTITITIEFSESVDVTGTPELTLDSGGTATYDSGTGTDTLTFLYTVGAGETTPRLSVVSIDLAGGTIKRASGSEDADLSIPSGENLNDNNDIAIGSATTDEYTSGFGQWIAPANLAGGSVTVECRGGGGTGGDGDATNGGRGGGGGGKVTVTMPVSPGESCTWSIIDGDVNFQTDTGNVSAFRGGDGPGPQGGEGGQYSSGGDATNEDGEIGGYGQAASGTTGGNGGAGAASGGAGGTGGTSGNNGTAGSDVGGGGGGGGANASGGVGGAARLRITYYTT